MCWSGGGVHTKHSMTTHEHSQWDVHVTSSRCVMKKVKKGWSTRLSAKKRKTQKKLFYSGNISSYVESFNISLTMSEKVRLNESSRPGISSSRNSFEFSLIILFPRSLNGRLSILKWAWLTCNFTFSVKRVRSDSCFSTPCATTCARDSSKKLERKWKWRREKLSRALCDSLNDPLNLPFPDILSRSFKASV